MERIAIMKVWDVDLGLAIHIEAPNGRYIVIDLGSKTGVNPLKSLKNNEVGYMVITHPHHDHFSDIDNISYAYPKILWRVKSYTRDELMKDVRDEEMGDFIKYCDFSDRFYGVITSEESPSSGKPFDGLKAEVFSTTDCDKSNKNNFSGIVVLTLGCAKIVICGDNEKDSFKLLMNKDSFKEAVSNAYVLVAAHHGRESGYYEEFVDIVKPYLTIISDTTKCSTSVADKYSNKSKGFSVLDSSTAYKSQRKCLTTRSDGNIKVSFGYNNDVSSTGILSASIHCSF